jgi:hypothetical protein
MIWKQTMPESNHALQGTEISAEQVPQAGNATLSDPIRIYLVPYRSLSAFFLSNSEKQ